MFPVKKVLANLKTKYYIRFRTPSGKMAYLDKSKYPDFYSEKAAKEWIKQNREKLLVNKKQADIVRDIKLRKKFPDMQILAEKFLKAQKEDAPNSYESSVLYLERFVFAFYLDRLGLNDINQWHKYFEDFRNYLADEATVKGRSEKIAYATKNHCIRTLNKFLSVMQRTNHLDSTISLKCRPFAKNLLNVRGYEHLFTPQETLYLKENLVESREFFIILLNTGMRFNEAYSLSIDDVREAQDLPLHLVKRFKDYKLKVYGFISLESQISGKSRNNAYKIAEQEKKKNKNVKTLGESRGLFHRKPLKSCKKINSKNRRIIPIFDKETWDIIGENYNRAIEDYHSRKYDSNPKDYFLLDVEPNTLRREFLKHTKKGFHAARHTAITYLTQKLSSDENIIKLISGHRSEAYATYVHLAQKLSEEAARKTDFKPIDFGKSKIDKTGT